jgi:hypothetical protein
MGGRIISLEIVKQPKQLAKALNKFIARLTGMEDKVKALESKVRNIKGQVSKIKKNMGEEGWARFKKFGLIFGCIFVFLIGGVVYAWQTTNQPQWFRHKVKIDADKASKALILNDVEYVWPSADGTASYYLQTDGSGTLSWAAGGTSVAWDDIGNPDASADTITFVDGIAVEGDMVRIVASGNYWYVTGVSNADGGITITDSD